jgi:hypothetical protein
MANAEFPDVEIYTTPTCPTATSSRHGSSGTVSSSSKEI